MKMPVLILLILTVAALSAEPRGLTSREIIIPDAVAVLQPPAALSIPDPVQTSPAPEVRDDWWLLWQMPLDYILPAGEQFGLIFVNNEQFAYPWFSGGAESNNVGYVLAALERAPDWIRAELYKTLSQVGEMQQQTYSLLIVQAPDPIVDEIAFCVATASPEYLNSDFAHPQLFTENAQKIYAAAAELPYVEIVDTGSADAGGDYWSTTRYWKKDAGGQLQQITVPREIYYWYLVNPKLTDEIQAYIDPSVVENNSTHSNNIADPPTGKFWRSYLYDYDDDTHPVLRDTLIQCQSVFNRDGSPGAAIRAATWWINQNMSFTSNAERPHQPVRIFTKRFGRCGEYADLSSAVARIALIPCTNISSVSTDHTWNEFWEDGWVSWEPVNGYLNNPLVYENGWGKVFGSVFEERSDGLFSPVTERYSDGLATINIQVVDQNLQPIDAARVVLAIFETTPRFDCEAYTDNNGLVSFTVGENRDYRARAETMFGLYPPNPGTYAQLVANSVDGEIYNYQFQIAAPLPQPTIEALAPPSDPVQDFRFTAGFASPGYFVTGKTLWDDIDVLGTPARFYQKVDEPANVSFLVTDADNAIFLDLDNFCSGYAYSGLVASGTAVFDIPAGQNWYALLNNSHRHGNAVLLSGALACEYWGTAVNDPQLPPALFSIAAAAPNPFSGATRIELAVKEAAEASIAIYNSRGQKIRGFEPQNLTAGTHELVWNGTDDRGETQPSGVYFIKVTDGRATATRRLLLLK